MINLYINRTLLLKFESSFLLNLMNELAKIKIDARN